MKNTFPFIVTLTATAILTASLLTSPIAYASQFTPGEMADGAPPELAHWGKLVGRWSTTEESLKPDGSEWVPSPTADWNFFWSFDGWGIQDVYTSPPTAIALDDESARQRGINLRIYNPAEEKWVLTWLTPKSTTPQTFTAQSNDDEIVMFADAINPQGFHSRITFFDMTDETFEWKLEFSRDQENWFEVHRIHGVKKAD